MSLVLLFSGGHLVGTLTFQTSHQAVAESRNPETFSPGPRGQRGEERESSLKADSIPTGGKIGAVHQRGSGRRVEPGNGREEQ